VVPDTSGSAADFLRSVDQPATDDDDGDAEIEVLEENWEAVQVFTRCRQDYAASMTGAFALGLNAREVEAACRLAGVALERWPEVSEHVMHMGCIAATELNKRKAS
jgi:L-fucose isomerase-like protein